MLARRTFGTLSLRGRALATHHGHTERNHDATLA